jgi:hypothetical protein
MSWDAEWRALRGRIDAVVLASQVRIGDDGYGFVKRFIVPDTKQIIEQLAAFSTRFADRLPASLPAALRRYQERVPALDQSAGRP